MGIKIVKCEARNAVNIGNIHMFCNEAFDDFKLMDGIHDLFRGSLNTPEGIKERAVRDLLQTKSLVFEIGLGKTQ